MRPPGFFERNLVAFAAGVGHELDDWCRWFATKWNQGPAREVGIFFGGLWRIVSWPFARVLRPVLGGLGWLGVRLVGRRRIDRLAAWQEDLTDSWDRRRSAWSTAVASQFDRLAGVAPSSPPAAAARPEDDGLDEDLEDYADDSELVRAVLEADEAERVRREGGQPVGPLDDTAVSDPSDETRTA